MSTKEGWTPIEIYKSAWARIRLQDPYAITLEPGQYGSMQIKFHTLGEVLDMAVTADLGPSESRDIPSQVGAWMFALKIAPIGAIDRATRQLPCDHNLNILAGWFNGGHGLPGPSWDGKVKSTLRYHLGHPSILNRFLRWLIRYLGVHSTIDGRIDRNCERVINVCRELRDELPVRRFP